MSPDTVAGVPASRTSHARARLAVAVAAGILVIATVITISQWTGPADPAASGPVTDEQVSAQCLHSYRELNSHSSATPVQRLVVRHGDKQLRVYVSEPDNWISVCRSGPSGEDMTFGTVMQKGPADRIRLFGDLDSVLKANVVLGHLPARASTIEAQLVSGRTVTGTRDGDIFVIWEPDGAVEGARLTASGPKGSVIATATAPRAGG